MRLRRKVVGQHGVLHNGRGPAPPESLVWADWPEIDYPCVVDGAPISHGAVECLDIIVGKMVEEFEELRALYFRLKNDTLWQVTHTHTDAEPVKYRGGVTDAICLVQHNTGKVTHHCLPILSDRSFMTASPKRPVLYVSTSAALPLSSKRAAISKCPPQHER